MKVRLSCCFDCTVEVPDGSTKPVSLQEAKDAVDWSLPYVLDGEEFLDCTVNGVCNFMAEELP
jgi:hypothetical protein